MDDSARLLIPRLKESFFKLNFILPDEESRKVCYKLIKRIRIRPKTVSLNLNCLDEVAT